MNATDIATHIKAETTQGIVRFANDRDCLAELPTDDIGQAALASFGTFYTFDIETHRSANAADFVLALDVAGIYNLLANLIAAKATTPRKVGDFIYSIN